MFAAGSKHPSLRGYGGPTCERHVIKWGWSKQQTRSDIASLVLRKLRTTSKNAFFVADGRTTHALLNIIVEDVNDENPYFDPVEYNVSLNKEGVTKTSIVTVLARDKDFTGASEIRYFMENSSSGTFRVDETSGRIYVDKPSQIGAASQYTLHVRAKDNGGLTSGVVR